VKTISSNMIALVCLILGFILVVYLFAESRNDPSLRIAALVAGTGYVSMLGAIGSTILTGKDLTKPREPSEQPPQQPEGPAQPPKQGE